MQPFYKCSEPDPRLVQEAIFNFHFFYSFDKSFIFRNFIKRKLKQATRASTLQFFCTFFDNYCIFIFFIFHMTMQFEIKSFKNDCMIVIKS